MIKKILKNKIAVIGLVAIGLFVGSAAIAGIYEGMTSESTKEEVTQIDIDEVSEEIVEETPEKTKDDKINDIMKKAEETEKTIYVYNNTKEIKKMFNYIVMTVRNNDIFDNDESMENIMYYGRVLELYSQRLIEKGDTSNSLRELNKLGVNSIQMVKYVYRGLETSEDKDTITNINQVESSANKLREYISSL